MSYTSRSFGTDIVTVEVLGEFLIPGLYSLDSSSTFAIVTSKSISRCCPQLMNPAIAVFSSIVNCFISHETLQIGFQFPVVLDLKKYSSL